MTEESILQALPEWVNENLFKWVANNGLAVVFVILLLGVIVGPLLALLRYVIRDAVGHFNTRLDTSSMEVSAGFRELTRTLGHLDQTLDRLTEQSAANHEALTSLMLFQAHTQAEVIAHRANMESGQDPKIPTPAPPVGVVKPVEPQP